MNKPTAKAIPIIKGSVISPGEVPPSGVDVFTAELGVGVVTSEVLIEMLFTIEVTC